LSRLARIFSVFVALIAFAAVLAACGGGGSDDPQSIIDEATLQGIESGDLDLAVDVGVVGKKGGDLEISLSGPFQSDGESELPDLDISLAAAGSIGGEKIDREGGLTLLGNKAYVGYEGDEYEVDRTTFDFVRSLLKQQTGGQSGETSTCQDAVSGLELGDFAENLKEESGVDVGGTSTTKVSGDLNATGAVEAVSELIDDPACSEQLNGAGPLPSVAELDKAKSTVKDSVKSAHVELYVGDDHIVRRITAKATIEPPPSADASAKRVDLDLDLTLTGVNEDQEIAAPTGSKPLSDLFIKLGINPIELLDAFQGGSGAQGLGGLLEGLNEIGGGSSGGGGSGGGQQSYYECLGEAHTPVDIQNCTGLLQ
jgi:hypothetical protein